MTIPAIVVPTFNQTVGVRALLDSIDHPVGRVIVIDNGGYIDPLIGGRNLYPFKVHVIATGHNLGVATSWNLGIKAWPVADWWLISNDDITFGAGDLGRWAATVEARAALLYKALGMAVFAVTPPLLQAVGWFDEAFINAYNEDLDYQRRCDLAGIRSVEMGFTGTHVGSATIMADPAFRWWNGRSHASNDIYYAKKWGGPKQGGETFETPFNRGAGPGDWQPDIERLRQFTWPREKDE